MAYNIVKHRRGTTQEWLEIDLVPEAGELVIEECADGTRKCKIGDGLLAFSKLPYLDDETQHKLLDELKALRQEFTNDLEVISANFDNKLSTSVHTLDESIKSAASKIEIDAANNLLKADSNIRAHVASTVEATKKDLQQKITAVEMASEGATQNLTVELQKASADLNTKVDTAVANASNELQEAISEVSKSFDVKLGAEAASHRLKVAEIEKNLTNISETIEEHIQPTIAAIDTKHTEAIKVLEDKHTELGEQISHDLADKTSALASQIEEQNTNLKQALNDKADTLTADYNTKIADAKVALQKLLEDSAFANEAELKTVQATLEAAIAAQKSILISDIDKVKTDLVTADELLATALNNLSSANSNSFSDIAVQLTNLRNSISELLEADSENASNFATFENITKQAIVTLQNDLGISRQKHMDDYVRVSEELTRLEAVQKTADEALTDTFLEVIAKVYIELADLVDDDIMILKKLHAVDLYTRENFGMINNRITTEVDSVRSDFSGSLNTLSTSTTENINELDTRLNASIENLNKLLTINIETLRSTTNMKFSEQRSVINSLATTIEELETSTQAKLDSMSEDVDAATATAGKLVSDALEQVDILNNKVDVTNEEIKKQADRLSTVISLKDGSTTGDLELIDIRQGYDGIPHVSAGDAVRAIGHDLDALKASLPDYIPSNSVDGLLYEDNLLYLTSKGEAIGDPVEITGGGGGGGSTSTVKVKNNLATNTFTIAKGNEAWINFTYTSFENEVPTGDGTCVVLINSKRIDALSRTVIHNNPNNINVADYLRNGANTVKVSCTDQYGVTRSIVYNISVIELRITSTFNSSEISDGSLSFRYKVYGQIEKKVYITIDGDIVSDATLGASVDKSELTLNIPNLKTPKLSHGKHTLTAYMTAVGPDGDDIVSNTLKYEFLCVESDRKEAMLATVFEQDTATQGDMLSIPFQVYDPSTTDTEVELVVYSLVGGEETEYSRTVAAVGRELSYWNTRQYPTGSVIFKVIYTYSYYGETRVIERKHELFVEPLSVDVYPETDGLQLYLTSQGRSNKDPVGVRDAWTFKSDNIAEPLVTTTFENFNWSTNGWVSDDQGDTCLRLNGDAKANINFKPFNTDFKTTGKTIEVEFSVRDVNNRNAVIMDCYNGTHGFRVTPDLAFLESSGTKVSCRFKDEERIRISITVEQGDSRNLGSQFVSIYLDGILSGVQRYDYTTDSFKQTNPLTISLGDSNCGIDLYNIRVYGKALSAGQILNNYIADKAEPTTKLDLLADNNILFDEDDAPDPSFVGQISYDKLKGKIPIITFTGSMPTFKGDKKKNSVKMSFEDPEHPELNFTDVLLKEIDVQGTSSAGYVRKNWKIKFNEERRHMADAIPAKVFCIKVDYAEATGTHNTGTANYIETLYNRNESIIPPQLDNTKIRTTIQGFPCVIFEKTTEDAEPVFSSKGNFNYDKGAEDVFGFTDKYSDYGVECWEFCNNISDSVSFLGPIPDDWKDDFEPRYTPIKSLNDPKNSIFDDIEDLIYARENAKKGDGIFTAAQQEELSQYQAMCIANFRELHNWVLSTATFKLVSGTRVPIVPANDTVASELTNAEEFLLPAPVVYSNTTYTYDTEEYRLAKFKNEFKDHFDMHYATMYYVFTFFALMVDQRAKNMFLTRWKNSSDGKYRWYPYFYDNDTIFGINNVGALVFDYFHEDTDQIDSSDVYNGQNSTLWNNFRLCFSKEIETLYRTLRSDSKVTYDKIIEQYITNGSDKWNAAIYNADAEYKYVSMARPDETGKYDATNLGQVRGPGEHHLRYFIANRLNYCDSKWFSGNYPSDQIVLRLYTPKITTITDEMTEEKKLEVERSNARILESQDAVKASSDITVTPYSDMYVGISYASGTRQQQRLSKGESHTFRAPEGVNTNDAETSIYGASMLSSLGDLSNLYCDYIDLSNATKLTTLKVGHEDSRYHNDNITKITLGNNRLLKYLDLRNCSGLGTSDESKTLILSGCQNIETIYAEGTNIQSVSLPVGGYIKTLHLPASINSLNIRGHQQLTDFSLASYSNLRKLHIEDCPTLDTLEMLKTCQRADNSFSITNVYLKGFSWPAMQDATFIKQLIPRFDENGTLISGILGMKANGEVTSDPAYLEGTCYINEITGAEYTEIKSYFPYLKINFGKMTSNVIFNYKDVTGEEQVKTIEVQGFDSATGTCVLPTFDPAPAWPENAAFTYELVGWSEMEQTSKGLEDTEEDYKAFPDAVNGSSLTGIAGDRRLYPVFKAIRKSYEVRFINQTDSDPTSRLIHSVMVPYGSDALQVHDGDYIDYEGNPISIPEKKDAASSSLYAFNSWYPMPYNITGPMECYAVFNILDSSWYTISINDISDCLDYNNNIYQGYKLFSDQTMAITNCNNKFNIAVRIPEQLDILRENLQLHEDLQIAVDEDTYDTICFDYKFKQGNSLSFRLYDKALQKYYGTFNLGPENTHELYDGIVVTDIKNGYYRITIDLAAITKAGDADDIENAPANIGTLYFIGADSDVTGYVDHVRCINATVDKTYLVHSYTVVNVGGFDGHSALELVSIPTTVTKLSSRAFAECSKLFEITLPDSITTIEGSAFQSCVRLTEIKIPANVKSIGDAAFADCINLQRIIIDDANTNFIMLDNCLVDANSKVLLQALPGATIPSTVSRLGYYCFANTSIESIEIPDHLDTISNNAFSNCKQLKTIRLHDNLKVLDATCFAWCVNLRDISLPEGLEEIRTYVFDGCALKNVTIPSTVKKVLDHSFGEMSTLEEVTFVARPDSSVPSFHIETFKDSGTMEKPIVFNLPWTSDKTPDAPWGAKAAILKFEDQEIRYNC